MLAKGFSKPTDRVERLRSMIVNAVPCIEAERAVLITESYKATEGLPMIMRRAKALENILNNLTVTIRDDELVVGTLTKAVRSCQLFPENSYKWVMDEFDTIETRIIFFIIPQIRKKTTCFCEIFDCTIRKAMLEYILGKDGNNYDK